MNSQAGGHDDDLSNDEIWPPESTRPRFGETMSETEFPSRYENREQARRRFGDDADRYAGFYLVGDPVADALVGWIERHGESAKAQFELALRGGLSAVPEASPELRGFFERADALPAWVDFDQIRTGALAYQRFGILGMIVLSAWSLINGYHSSAAVKPLLMMDGAQRLGFRKR